MGGVVPFGVVACVQEVAVTPGELLADADLIHYTTGASEKDEEEAGRKAVDFCTTARRQTAAILIMHQIGTPGEGTRLPSPGAGVTGPK